ncbi:MAG: glycosyltransferase family 9 protein [Candidatus Dactylopiibacterium sp.]|nr:glycosyltransferase family 9 protein [Candidatus Dactylopiibacterium sp.]
MSRNRTRLKLAGRLARSLLNPFSPRRQRPDAPRRILVLHHLLLGDTLMLTPLLARLAERYPQAERYLACPAAVAPLFAGRPFGVTALPWQPRRGDVDALFAHAPFDLVIIPAENRYSPLARALGRWVVGFGEDTPAWKNWLLDESHPFPQAPAAFGDFCATLADATPPRPYQPAAWPLPPAASFEAPPAPYVVLHLGASSPLKYWPAERWATLAAWLAAHGLTPVWSAGAREGALVADADPQGRFPSYAGALDLPQLARLFAAARLIVCPDTGVAHLARIVGTPTVALFGPGSPRISGAGEYWRDAPFTALSIDIACRNQTHTFRRQRAWIQRCSRSLGHAPGQCPRAACMEGITLEAVQKACLTLLGHQEAAPA